MPSDLNCEADTPLHHNQSVVILGKLEERSEGKSGLTGFCKISEKMNFLWANYDKVRDTRLAE